MSFLTILLHRLDVERAHTIALHALRLGIAGRAPAPDRILATTALGLAFPTPLGLAAGFDKNAVAIAPLLDLGFGCVEIGTVTPLPQTGNPRPRLFRLTEDQAVINRMGFNGQGADRVERRLRRLRATRPRLRYGVNIGINKQGSDPIRDYPALVTRFAPLADYITINVSSPNTPGLRDLQAEHALRDILAALPRNHPPILVKLAPDLAPAALPAIVETCIAGGAEGLVISNTTTARPALFSQHASEPGGLSGAPLFARSTEMLSRAYALSAGRLTLIGAGGIATGQQALAKIKAGASLVQAYTGFAYAGPAFATRLNRELAAAMRAEGFHCVQEAIGKAHPVFEVRA